MRNLLLVVSAVVVSTDVRRYVRTLLDPVLPRVPVLSFQELDEDVTLLPVGWVDNPPPDPAEKQGASA